MPSSDPERAGRQGGAGWSGGARHPHVPDGAMPLISRDETVMKLSRAAR